jgi:hypothetical protein
MLTMPIHVPSVYNFLKVIVCDYKQRGKLSTGFHGLFFALLFEISLSIRGDNQYNLEFLSNQNRDSNHQY